jgi:dihydrodipicolinate synthase/N-acetylneuraminate lyase
MPEWFAIAALLVGLIIGLCTGHAGLEAALRREGYRLTINRARKVGNGRYVIARTLSSTEARIAQHRAARIVGTRSVLSTPEQSRN